jgi:hypothetical protein
MGAKREVENFLLDKLASSHFDTRFFLGNISSHPDTFTIVGLWYPKFPDKKQGELFAR